MGETLKVGALIEAELSKVQLPRALRKGKKGEEPNLIHTGRVVWMSDNATHLRVDEVPWDTTGRYVVCVDFGFDDGLRGVTFGEWKDGRSKAVRKVVKED